jgi:hypothetical protein
VRGLAFHYGVPADATILAVATSLPFASPSSSLLFLRRCRRACACRNGQIKLFARDNTQALLQSPGPLSSMFLRVLPLSISIPYVFLTFGCDSLGCSVSVCRGPTSSSQCQHSEPDRGNFFSGKGTVVGTIFA